jgi:hypothetical protein
MASSLQEFAGNTQLMVHKMKKMTDKPMEINKNVLFVDSYLLVVCHEYEEEILVSLNVK